MELNDQQKLVVQSKESRILVVAGPGTGKTRVITERLKYLLNHGEVSIGSIMVVTFSNRAAGEITERLEKDNIKSDWVGTFHGLCFKLLIFYGGYGHMKIIDEQDQKQIIDKLELKTLTVDKISGIKDGILDMGMFLREFTIYNDYLKENNRMDFSDIINHTIELLQYNESIKNFIVNKFTHIMVDEYQDTSTKQNELIFLLAEKATLCCVGDDDQSIYGWRGANVQNIINYSNKNDVTVYHLDQNYRSTKNIVELSKKIISFNRMRIIKNSWTANENGQKAALCCSSNEADFIAKNIRELRKENSDYTFGILVRTGSLVQEFREELEKLGIKCTAQGSINFFQRMEIKVIINYMRGIFLNDALALEYVINTPRRGIGPKKIGIFNDSVKSGVDLMESIKIISQEFYDQLKSIEISENQSPCAIIVKILELFPEDFFEEERIKNIKLLIDKAKNYDNIMDFLGMAMLGNIDLIQDKVQIMTIHGAKGLEFDYVFLPQMVEGIFPNHRGFMENPEEERRLAYVAFTRAKFRIFMSYNLQRQTYNRNSNFGPSRFIHILPQNLISFMLN